MRKSLFLLLLCVSMSFAQDYPGAPIPDLFPTSPEAGNLGKYGDVKTSSHTGNMNFSVPIHSIKSGDYTWPISLNYSYGGLLLEGKQSIMGLGWNLSGTGAVTREVRGLPDEAPNGYYGANNVGARINDYVENNNGFTLAEFRSFKSGQWDAQADIYHLRAGGVSFSFKLGENSVPVFLSQHNHRIEYTDSKITMTDDNGIVYKFSDLERNEPSDASPRTLFEYTITWNLSEVIYPSGRSIRFEYQDDQYLSFDFFAQGSNVYFPNGLQDGTADGSTAPTYGVGSYQDGINQTIINRKLLKRIISSDMEIISFAIEQGRKLYSGLSIKKQGQVNTFAFSYEGPRDVLTRITKNQQLVYGFEYYDQMSLPSFFNTASDKPLAQDDWRFFNAKPNQYAINIPSSAYSADKTPDFWATRKGAMRKIVYPTGGYSLIDYEQNQVKEEYSEASIQDADVPLNKTLRVAMQSDGVFSAPLVKETIVTHTFDRPTVAIISSNIRGTRESSHLLMSISKADSCPASVGQQAIDPISDDYYVNAAHFRSILGEIPQMCPTLGEEFGPDNGAQGYFNLSHNSGGRIIIKPGTYTFKIINDYNRTSDAYGEIKVKFHYTVEEPIETISYVNVNVGGIRIQKIQHFSNEGTEATTQYFGYNDDDNFSTGILLNRSEPIHFNKVIYSHPEPNNPSGRTEFTQIAFPFGRFNSLNINQSAPVFYKMVREYDAIQSVPNGQVVFSRGYKETKFENPSQNYDPMHPRYPLSQDLSIGRVKETSIFNNQENSNVILNKSENTHKEFRKLIDQNGQDFSNDHPWSIIIVQKLNIVSDCTIPGACELNPIPSLEHYEINRHIIKSYREVHKEFKLKSTLATNYFDTNSLPRTVSTITSNKFNDHYAISETEMEKSDGSTIKTIYKYPYDDLADFTDLGTEASTGVDLLNQANRIASPIQIQTYKKEGSTEKSLFLQRTDYSADSSLGTTLLLPEKLLVAKGEDSLEDRLIYHSYDDNGNPLEVSIEGGTRISYVWGYNATHPIVKLEHVSYATMTTVQHAAIEAVKAASNLDNDVATENALRLAQKNLRAVFPEAMVTTYTYDPLIGVTSMTDPRGYTMYYEYDEFNRLKQVRDAKNNLLSKNEYNYALQPQN